MRGNSSSMSWSCSSLARTGGGVDRPAPQCGRAALDGPVRRALEHAGPAHGVEHEAVAVVVGVEGVEDVAGVDVDPGDVAVEVVAGDEPEPGGVVRLPVVGEALPGHRRVEVEHRGEVVDDDPSLGERGVVHHRTAGGLDEATVADLALLVDHEVLDVVAPAPVVVHRVPLPGNRVVVGVGGETGGQSAAEVARRHGVELGGELIGPRPGFHTGEEALAHPQDAGVGREVPHLRDGSRVGRLAEGLGHGCRTDPPVAVPDGLAVAEANAVDHAVAGEPVVGVRVLGSDRVGPVAEVAAVELGRDRARHRQVGGGELVGNGGEVPLEVRVRHAGLPSSTVPGRSPSLGG